MPEHGRAFPDKARHERRQVHRGRFGFGYGYGYAGLDLGRDLDWLDREQSRIGEFENGMQDVDVDTSAVTGDGGE